MGKAGEYVVHKLLGSIRTPARPASLLLEEEHVLQPHGTCAAQQQVSFSSLSSWTQHCSAILTRAEQTLLRIGETNAATI